MGFRSDSFATVWQVESKNPNWTKVRLNISRKNKQTDEYEQDFSGWVDFFGSATAAKAAKLKEKDRIKLIAVDVTNSYDKEKKITYWNPKCFEFEMADAPGSGGGHSGSSGGSRQAAQAAYEGNNPAEDDNEEFPF